MQRVEGKYFYTIEGNTNVHDPDDPVTLEGLYVMSNKRLIKDYIFGVPRYQSDNEEHAYVERYESAHPHKIYYECSICGYTYHTQRTAVVEDCKKCIPCACYGTTVWTALPGTPRCPMFSTTTVTIPAMSAD